MPRRGVHRPRSAPPVAGPTATERSLAERVKELNCLYALSRLVDRRDASLDDIFQETAGLMCQAWQYPEVTSVRLTLGDREYRSPRWSAPRWKQECPLVVLGAPAGGIEVGYTAARPACDEGPFLHEERNLLNVIAQRLSDVTERKWAERQLMSYQEQLRSLTAELSLSEERERRRIAQALHDRIGQVLALVHLKLGALVSTAGNEAVERELRDVRRLVWETITDTRFLTFDLSPPILYELGLEAAIEWLGETLGRQFGVSVVCDLQTAEDSLGEELRVMLFQSVRELLTNVGKHAKAAHAWVSSRRVEGSIEISVRDDGVGLDPAGVRLRAREDYGFGLFNIQERVRHLGGRLAIESERGHGARFTLILPVRRVPPRG